MHKILVVAWREYQAAVRTKAFLIGLLLMPLMMGLGLAVQVLLSNVHDTAPKHVAVIDRSGGRLAEQIERAVQEHNEKAALDAQAGRPRKPVIVLEVVRPSADDPDAVLDQRFELSERVRRGELVGFLDVGPEVLTSEAAEPAERSSVRYHTARPTYADFSQLADRTVNRAVQDDRATRHGRDVKEIREIVRPVKLESRGLLRQVDGQGIEDAGEGSQLGPVLVPIVLSCLMLSIVMMSAAPMTQGIVEEKMQRVAEVLLGSVRPFHLMLGKLVGMTAVSLTMSGFYLAGLLISARHWHFGEYLTVGLLLWFLAFQVLACLMFGSLFIAVGAACSDLKETQIMLWPVVMVAVLPLFVLPHALGEPNGAVATTMSYFPFSAPTSMVTRMSIPPGVGWWEPPLAALGVLLTALSCTWAAGRIFRVGMLMQGQGARPADMLRWVLRG